MMSDAEPGIELDLRTLYPGLIRSPDGLWLVPNHSDLGFLDHDDTDWLAIEQQSFWYRHRNRIIMEALRYFPPSSTIFDVGAGNGSVSLAIQAAGHPIVAIEPTVRFAHNARKRGVHNVICATLEEVGFRNGALENVGIFDVLEHIEDDAAYLSMIRKLMPAGGRLYCTVPAWNFLWSTEDRAADHIRRYTLGELRKKVRRSGFEIEYDSYFFAPLILPILLLRALPSALGIRTMRTASTSYSEHVLPPGFAKSVLDKMLTLEERRIKAQKRIPMGANCLLVTRVVS